MIYIDLHNGLEPSVNPKLMCKAVRLLRIC